MDGGRFVFWEWVMETNRPLTRERWERTNEEVAARCSRWRPVLRAAKLSEKKLWWSRAFVPKETGAEGDGFRYQSDFTYHLPHGKQDPKFCALTRVLSGVICPCFLTRAKFSDKWEFDAVVELTENRSAIEAWGVHEARLVSFTKGFAINSKLARWEEDEGWMEGGKRGKPCGKQRSRQRACWMEGAKEGLPPGFASRSSSKSWWWSRVDSDYE